MEIDILNPHRSFGIFANLAKRYESLHELERARRKARERNTTKESMSDAKKGLSRMCKAVSGAGAQPLRFAKRDQMGPQGQGVGTTATNPIEVDEIARRKWLAIYAGKFQNRHRGVAMFMKKYAKEVGPKCMPHILRSIEWTDLKEACIHAKASAGGLDGFSPADFRLLSDEAFRMLNGLLELIEEGAAWPTDTNVGRLAFMSKDNSKLDDALAYRLLSILSVLVPKVGNSQT